MRLRTMTALLLLLSCAAGSGADDRALAAHVLGRLGYGPRPGELERVAEQGVDAWIRRQLDPSRIDESALEARLATLPSHGLSTAELRQGYQVPREMRREIERRRAALGDDPSRDQLQALRREVKDELGGSMQGTPQQLLSQAQSARVLRAVYAERQLEEVMVELWLNHFNVYAAKGQLRYSISAYEQQVIRPHALGRFEDLLLATAKSPAMLFYLDNWLSVDPEAAARRAARRERSRRRPAPEAPRAAGRRSGLNENYARELLELHTLGVDGGYQQFDVTELARILSGWTLQGLRDGEPRFFFDARVHDRKDKLLLGQRIAAGGVEEGEQALRQLARHPSTARFVCFKLLRRFLADEPPAELVERTASVFTRTGGDIRKVVESIALSPEFLSPRYRNAKVKTPLEFVASAVRALGGEVERAQVLVRILREMGMPPLLQAPPTGYPDVAREWVSTNGAVARLSFAAELARSRVRGVSVPAPAGDTEALIRQLVPQGVGEQTRSALGSEGGDDPARVAGLLLGSPEFQRR